MTRTSRVLAGLALLALVCLAGGRVWSQEKGPREGASPLEIAYPEDGAVVRRDCIPVWLLAREPVVFDSMTVRLNGEDRTAEFLPWGARRNDPREEALALIRPLVGENHLDVQGQRPDGSPFQVEGRFRFDPETMLVTVDTRENGRPVPARVVFRGLGETPDPRLAPEVWSTIAPRGAEEERNFVHTEGAPLVVRLPPGRYEVFATRGPGYSLVRMELGAEGGTLTFELERVFDRKGWVSADFHVHAIPSGDSSIPLWDRLVSYRAQDVDVIVASDHHTITDYREELRGRREWPAGFEAIPGVESESKDGGHWNFWPLVPDREDPTLHQGGGRAYGAYPEKRYKNPGRLAAYFEDFNVEARRARYGDAPIIVQLNHPRGIRFSESESIRTVHDFLNDVRYDPRQPLSETDNGTLLRRPAEGVRRPIDVDAIELLNRLAFGLYVDVREDWFAWIRGGIVPTAMANTDSHWLVVPEAGTPRNWVRHDGGMPCDAASLVSAVRARQVVGSTGPLVSLSPWTEDGYPYRGPVREVEVEVVSPPWMPVEEVRLYYDGQLARVHPFENGAADPYATEALKYRATLPVGIEDDAFLFVEVGDSRRRLLNGGPPVEPLHRVYPRTRVLAFSNVLLVDAKGDGSPWDEWLENRPGASPR